MKKELIKAVVVKDIKAFTTYLDEENKEIILSYPKLRAGDVVWMPPHLFFHFYEKGVVDYYRENEREEKNEEKEEEYAGLEI